MLLTLTSEARVPNPKAWGFQGRSSGGTRRKKKHLPYFENGQFSMNNNNKKKKTRSVGSEAAP